MLPHAVARTLRAFEEGTLDVAKGTTIGKMFRTVPLTPN